MEGTPDPRGDLFSDPDLWLKESLLSNVTPANASTDHTVVMSPAISLAINIISISTLIIAMFSLGCTMEWSKIKHHLMKPKGVAIALLSQYGVMPLTAFSLCKAFQLSEIAALVILICGCSPGGNLSNALTLAVRGDMNLSIAMTSCSTLLALGMMPLLVYIYCHSYPDLQRFVPYLDIIKGLFMTVIPCGVGILINHYRPQNAKAFKPFGLSVMIIGAVAVAVLTSIGIGGSILTVLSPSFMAISALMPFIGFTLGYIISSLFRLNHKERMTVAMETGCQNNQMCITILTMAFTPAMIGPLFLFPIVYTAFQMMEVAVLMVLLWCYQRFGLKERETYSPAIELEEPPEDLS